MDSVKEMGGKDFGNQRQVQNKEQKIKRINKLQYVTRAVWKED